MQFVKPKPTDVFTVTSDPAWPSIEFQTDGKGAHVWTWTITWGAFKTSGTATTGDNRWDAQQVVTNWGGTLAVTAQASQEKATISVSIKGTNPGAEARDGGKLPFPVQTRVHCGAAQVRSRVPLERGKIPRMGRRLGRLG